MSVAGWSTEANAGFAAMFGTITDKQTQRRIDGARLELDIHTETIVRHTHPDGVYFISTPNGDGFTLKAFAEGYCAWSRANIALPNNYQMLLNIELEPGCPPPAWVNHVRIQQQLERQNYSTSPYRVTRPYGVSSGTRVQLRSAPANPELLVPEVWILPSEENEFVAQIEIKGSGLDAIEEVGIYDEAGELVPNVKVQVSNASPESIVIEYQLRDNSSANLVRSIRLRAGEEIFSVPMRHDFY
jgi:hypothetical protein